ncbi:hypothetical protein T440DRAFT_480030 [Plenodomus tracheiphilus IPT5]|uniref:Uncharacterized protein n=1 Tax=Plenodomus tracheiphilus IPT5 TaxID=1408161 RepID=A0A6A7B2J4_9PLEO|nr:hypothetical protein T440DRAFT_480030 [Plenodomus tracheiphilus IPT5]
MPTTPPRHLTTSSTTNPLTTLTTLQTSWHTTKRSSPLLARLGMRGAEILALAVIMLIVPLMIQSLVLCFGQLYEVVGRRARSPYTGSSWGSVDIAMGLMVGWVGVLGWLGYRVDFEGGRVGGEKEGRSVSWGRVVGRIGIPLLLIVLMGHFAVMVLRRVVDPLPFVMGDVGIGPGGGGRGMVS